MGSSLYQDRKYEVGQRLLTLRARTRLTQMDLAGLIGVNRRSVQNWEAGVSYPKEDHLRQLIAVFLEHSAFTHGREREEAETLWEQVSQDAPRPLPLFDVPWFEHLPGAQQARSLSSGPLTATSQIETKMLDAPPPSAEASSTQGQRPSTHPEPPALGRALHLPPAVLDWGEAIDVPILYGRDTELATLQEWVLADRCRVVAVLGLGGIGKTSLALTLTHAVAPHFEAVFFRSLRNAPLPGPVLDDLIQAVSGQQATLPDTAPGKIALLVEWLRQRRCLLILDNLETIMQEGARAGDYRANYADYGTLIQRLGEGTHQSCLLLTSREKPAELGPLEGSRSPVRALALRGLDESACYAVLEDHELSGVEADWATLAHLYGGNPLALKLVSEPIREIFGGDIAAFLHEGDAFFNGVGQLLEAQFARSTPLEQALLLWLAIARDLASLNALQADLAGTAGPRDILQALESLRRRYLIERAEGRPAFTLQPVILEYVTDQLVEAVRHELMTGQPKLLRSHALVQATAKEYVRHSQEQLIATPLLERLAGAYGDADTLERRLLMLLASWREQPRIEQGYGPGNVINLLRLLRGHLRGLDLARLAIRQAYLAEVDAQDARLVDAHLAETVLAEAFHFPGSVALSGDGGLLAAGTSTGQVWLWRVADRTSLWAVQGHTGAIRGVALSADGQLVASGSFDGTVRLWEASSGRSLATLQGHTGAIRGVALSADGQLVASGSFDGTVRLWDANASRGRPLATLQGHTGAVWGVALSADGQLVASGGDDGTVRLWDASSGRPLATLQGHTGAVRGVALSADGQLVASGSFDGTVKLWDANASSGRPLATLQGHTGWGAGVALSADGQLVVSGSFDGTVKLWDANASSGRPLATLQGHTSGVAGVALSADGQLVASGSFDGTVKLWDANASSGRLLATLSGHTGGIWGVALSADGQLVASSGDDGTVRLWDANASSDQPLWAVQGHTSGVAGVAISADGQLVASGSFDGTVKLWEASSGRSLATFLGHTGAIRGVAISADGRLVASGSFDGTVRLWDANTSSDRPLATLLGHTGGVAGVALNADGQLVASGSFDGTVRLWDANASSDRPLATLQGHTGVVWGVALSADGQLVASGGDDGTVRLWNTNASSDRPLATLQGHTGVVGRVALSADGQLVASGSDDGTVRLWDANARSGRSLTTLLGHTGVVWGVALSADGRLVASGSFDGTVKLWDAKSGVCLRTLRAERRYERMDISGLLGITAAQRASLIALGAVERPLDHV